MKPFDVVGLGYCNIDYLGIAPHYPALDEKVKLLEFTRQGGGVTGSAMAAVARLGGKARYIGKIGDDDFGRFLLAEFQAENVDTGALIVQPSSPTPFSFIVVDQATGKRTILWTPSGMMLYPHEVRREDVITGKVLHVDAHYAEAAMQAALWANEANIPVVMDAGSFRHGSIELMERTDFLIASELFAKESTGSVNPEESVRRLFSGRRKLAAVTLGERGCIYMTSEGMFRQPAFTVDVVDTTGAGDVFHGAFSYGLAQNWEYADIIRFASAVAALKCTKLGGRAGIPTLDETMSFLDAQSQIPR